MKTWTIVGALLVAGTMLGGSAFAQTTTPGAGKDMPKGSEPSAGKSEGMKSDSMKSDTGAKSGEGGRMAGGNREQVKAAQEALKDKGHDPGEIDGVMGPKTQEALKDFQSKEGLNASGQLDRETMSKLGIQAKAGAARDTGSSSPAASPSTSGGSSGTK
jgi:peptidoglycan hydrolase-like protein with peptidoglycan-binding domain